MFAKVIESEIEWCENNNGAMPEEFRKGFIAGLKQAVYLMQAVKQRMVWTDGEMIEGDDLLTRAAEPLRAPAQSELKCPTCEVGNLGKVFQCDYCFQCFDEQDISERSDGG